MAPEGCADGLDARTRTIASAVHQPLTRCKHCEAYSKSIKVCEQSGLDDAPEAESMEA